MDDVGFVPFTPEGAQLLFQTFSERYLKGSILITSNLEFSRWLKVFGDERLTGASPETRQVYFNPGPSPSPREIEYKPHWSARPLVEP